MIEVHTLSSQSCVELDQVGDNGLILNDVYLPIELIQRILFFADEKTLLNCQLVCNCWNTIITDYVWRKKAEMKTSHKFSPDAVLDWKDFYLIYAKDLFRSNLIKNPSGEEGFKYWKISNSHHGFFGNYGDDFFNEERSDDDSDTYSGIDRGSEENSENGRSDDHHNDNHNENEINNEIDNENFNNNHGWIIECPPCGAPLRMPSEPEFGNEEHCFVTTYYDCSKEYEIDLIKEGFSTNILDNMQPPIEINEWYSCRVDCAAIYKLYVFLVSESGGELKKFVFETVLEGDRKNIWFNVKHEFQNYGRGLRKIRFIHGGRDQQFWAGHYGSKMAGACVKAKIPDGF